MQTDFDNIKFAGYVVSFILWFRSGWCNEEECKQTIQEVWRQDKYMVDPHTAVAIKVAKEFKDKNKPMLITSTAHYSKFIEECKDIFNEVIDQPPPHENIEKCKEKKVIHQECIEANYDAVCFELTQFINDYFDH